MFKKLFGKKHNQKMYEVTIHRFDDDATIVEKWDAIGLNNLGIWAGPDYEILKVVEI